MDLTFTVFQRFFSENCHARLGDNWTANKGETEGGTICPPAYIITKYPSLNRVKFMYSPIVKLFRARWHIEEELGNKVFQHSFEVFNLQNLITRLDSAC